MLIIKRHKKLISTCVIIFLSGCASATFDPNKVVTPDVKKIKRSFLNESKSKTVVTNAKLIDENSLPGTFTRLNKLDNIKQGLKLEIDLSSQFTDESEYQVSVNALPLNDFLHYVLGELLNISYLIEPSVKSNTAPVTLELKERVSAKRLFQLVQQILNQNNIAVALNDGVFYVHPVLAKGNKSNMAFGFGVDQNDVPNVSSDIIQLVPVKYGTSTGMRTTVSSLVDATVAIDPSQGLVTLKGKREQIIRALSLIKLLDSATMHHKAIALLSFQYIDSETFITKVKELLAEEGIVSSVSRTVSSSIKFIPLEHLGKVVVFAKADEILDRVEYWAQQLDKAATGSEQSFYVYHPRYARAADLGQSLAPLISSSNRQYSANSTSTARQSNSSSSATKSQNSNNRQSRGNVQTIEGDNLRLVVDERSNSLIFYSTGKFYKELQPIIKKLDVMPKQVMLEVVIAEVQLTGTFAKGVEFALKSGRSGSKTEDFSFSKKNGFSYSVVGLDGTIDLNLNQTDDLINVLSRPTILVRDGVSASISVGDDIPTVGSTTSDPINGERETTTIQYRKIGVDLTVTPTVNAQGTVIMTIEQNISNVTPDGLSVNGSVSVFERKISTEVVAGDGQTVMLGGLISENKNANASAVPLLGSLPLLGHLFRNDFESSVKTELVVLVTPKIINNVSEWDRIQQSFIKGLENIELE